ncbi:Mfa1 family fimbria major subunit [Dysgonomonas macrotermitis]|uniref:Major fimbrial subunit protein type IV, Fimbrillin, C-terminal n=1 Tax=Dysgonomonas macrotermitis TaxID=1346286 RepID=A0A1M4XB32_9BACT|nr:Mfa1 family fimbria major subunit [Dysgonomonas macrotermitis]SHE90758.1 Major fimbrial subunit protein type IV, Fimbrillin, C-terminal [Dysgonomonas macrotermitis]
MNLRKILFTLTVATVLISCSDDKNDNSNQGQTGAETYVNLSVSLPGSTKTRALPGDYNEDGEYEGEDLIETLDIYLQSADGTVEAKRFTGSDISTDGTSVAPSQPFRTTSGYKTIYVVLNNPGPLGTTITAEDELVDITDLAQLKTVNGVNYDLVTMTGKTATTVFIAPDIPVQDVVSGISNKFPIEVTRIASRVIVTIASGASHDLEDEDGNVIGSVSNVTYSVAQGTNKVHWITQTNYDTWGTDYVPVLGEYANKATTYYEYADLSTPEAVPVNPTAADGYKSLKGKFLFENTHKEGTLKTTDYRKGNTAYVLVRAKFTPNADAITDGGTLTNGTFYVGYSNGLIYSTKAAAQTPPLGVQNQKVATYVEGKMLNYAWLNPDDLEKPLNSPVVRNNIYHINITGFKRLAYNWNPLYPEDPNTLDPNNPDPKPGPEEPTLPVDPIDPLTPEQTYMTVEITAKAWTVHSYDIEF